MKQKIFKIVTAIILLITLTMVNFIYVGAGLVSYAASESQTNHQNIGFKAELKDENTLTLEISVQKEGYFNGEIALENSNFKLKETESIYANKIEDNKITLNQINAGTTAKIEVAIEPVKNETIEVGMLNKTSTLTLTGIYRDSTERDIKINAKREVNLAYTENNNEENIENTSEVITNKIVKISGEEKRVVQISMNLGLKENNYPIKSINSEIEIPTLNGKEPEVICYAKLNNMTNFEYKKNEGKLELSLTNTPNEENRILWKKQGTENVVVTFIYDKDVSIEETKIPVNEKVTLYNNKELNIRSELVLTKEEKDSLVEVELANTENSIYKGKLYAGLDRAYETKTNIVVNLANAEEQISVKEEQTKYNINNELINANAVYNKTTLSKESFDKILGENGVITIRNQNGELIGTINNETKTDENGNIVVSYNENEVTSIEITTSTPVAEGNLEFTHTKTIRKQEQEIVTNAQELVTKVNYNYGTEIDKTAESKIKLEESKTEVTFEANKDSLSTVITNNVEIRATLKGNNEQYNLFKNPVIRFELPEEVENITVNSLDLIYETELKIRNYEIQGRTITVYLEGEQTGYKEAGIEGTVLVLNANITVNKKSATTDSKVTLTYENDGAIGTTDKAIKIVAPKDMTVVHSIKELGIETIGQTETQKITLARGTEARTLETEIEIINNDENTIENVKVLGTFPTRNNENSMDIRVAEGITINGVEGTKVYYTENENATEDLQNAQNGWKDTITDGAKVRKYLVEIPKMESKESIYGTYKIEVPAGLEYNQTAKQTYTVNYTNTLSKSQNEMKATTIELETGIGPKAEIKLTPTIGGQEVTSDVTAKNGEVIKYKMEVSNVGSEEISNILLQGNVPEGTTLVVPQDNYEYTGASYYKELPDKTYEAKIDTLKVGEVATVEYEVRVNTGVEPKTSIANETQIKYGDVTKTSNSTKILTESGDLRVSAKRVTDREIDIYEAGTVQYFAIIENTSGEAQENVKIKTNLPEVFEVSRLMLITGMESEEISDGDIHSVDSNTQVEPKEIKEEDLAEVGEDVETQELEYSEEVNIGTIAAGETKVLSYDMEIGKINDTNKVSFEVSATTNNKEHKSNEITDTIKKAEITLNMETNTESQYVKAGDILEYTITINNNGTEDIEGLTIKDTIPNSLTVNKVSFDGEEIPELVGKNEIEISCNIGAGTESVIKIETVVNYKEGREEPEVVTNVAYAELLAERIATTEEITHIIEANQVEGGGEETPGEGNENNPEDSDVANGTRIITGIAWFDQNADGRKDDNEQVFSNVKVRLLNTRTNNLVKTEDGNILEATTNENGVYVLNQIKEGSYIVIFDYDNTRYTLTKYKVANVEESKNSDAMLKEVTIENERQELASTDIIEIGNENISDVNIGFIELQNFDLKLEKFVSRILIQDTSGSTVKEYDNEQLAKAELDAKRINGATVIIEYKIRISNVGEVDGYAKKIVDYMPNDLTFNSELNKDWYQTSDGLYNTSLANEIIPAGEYREVSLTLTKSMTEDNTGLINNTAEIAEDYNELGIKDSNSTPANRANNENDYSSADVILSIRTGGAVYAGIVIGIIAVLGIIAYVIIRKKAKNNKKGI